MPEDSKQKDTKQTETKPVPFVLKDDPTFKQVLSVIGALGATLKEIQKGQQDLTVAVETVKSRGSVEEKPKDTKEPTDEEVNNLDQASLVKLIMSQVGKAIQGTSEKLDKNITGLSDKISETSIKAELKEFSKEHPDIFDLGDEIKDIVNENPGISISRAYTLARSENPEKAKELDVKYNPETGKGKPAKPFGGLTPTSGMTPGGEKEKMTPKAAADKAWEETLQSFPALAGATEE